MIGVLQKILDYISLKKNTVKQIAYLEHPSGFVQEYWIIFSSASQSFHGPTDAVKLKKKNGQKMSWAYHKVPLRLIHEHCWTDLTMNLQRQNVPSSPPTPSLALLTSYR